MTATKKKPTAKRTQQLYWHFLGEDRRLRYDDRRVVEVGQTIKVTGEIALCERGLHASRRAIDALQYAPGPIICRVSLTGGVLHESDKSVGRNRKVLAMADATKVLHEFACDCARDALTAAKVEDQRCWAAIDTKMRWLRGEATDAELQAALAAARDAARDAARAAAWAAARDAALAAAWAAAWDAARDAAWDAARDAARDKQNARLESMLKSLLECA